MQDMETRPIDLEGFPGALCRIDLAGGRVTARNASAGTLLARCASIPELMGHARYEALRDEALQTGFWAESTTATPAGRIRFRLHAVEAEGEGLVDLDLQHPAHADADLEALLDLIADARWEWDLRDGSAAHTGAGVLRSGIGGQGLPRDLWALLDLVHEDDRARVDRAARDYMEGRSSRYREEYRIRDDVHGGWRWVLSRGRAVERGSDGLPLRVVGLITDITRRREREMERSRLEAQLRHVQKLDALGQLTGGIAHDFNNILASVLGYAELGIIALEGSSDPVAGYLREVRSAADRGRELISKLLLFSRGQGETEDADRAAPVAMVADTVRMLRPMLPATLRVATEIDESIPAIGLEPTQLQQVLLNLTINARDAVGENGTVMIRVEQALAPDGSCASCGTALSSVTDDGAMVCLSVTDDGPGIGPDILANVFDPFFSTKETGRGSGLGLSVVHGIIHDHGGHIGIDTGDEGTVVRLYVPAARAEAREDRVATPPASIRGDGRRILVIDDESAIGRWMSALLEMRDFVVDVHDDPRTALARFDLTPDHWDLVITDQSMPGLSGVELADELMARVPDLPIIICSGFSEFVEAGNARDLGFAAFLEKPVSGDDLLATVGRVLEGDSD
jgi:signal transduction histidine kinase/CheY-like chemotaxis protein